MGATHHLLSSTFYLYLLPSTYHLLPTSHYLLSTIHYLLTVEWWALFRSLHHCQGGFMWDWVDQGLPWKGPSGDVCWGYGELYACMHGGCMDICMHGDCLHAW